MSASRTYAGPPGRAATALRVPTRVFSVVAAALLLAACAQPPDLGPLEQAVTARAARVPPVLAETDFGQAVREAVTASPTVGRSEAAVLEARAGVLAEGGSHLPQLSVGLTAPETDFGLNGVVSVTQLIYDGGAGSARRTAAQARLLGFLAGGLDARSEAALAAVEAWADLATARALVLSAEESLAGLEATAEDIRARAEAGAGTATEALFADARMENERAALVGARAEAARAEAVFAEVFGRAPPATLALPPLPPPPPPGEAAQTPPVRQAEAAVLAAEAELAAARAGRVPPLSVTLSAVPGGDLAGGLASDHLLAPGRGRAARIAAAEARFAARRADLDAVRRTVERSLRVAAADLRASAEREDAARRAAAANRQTLAAVIDQFEIGRSSLLALLDTRREALSAERTRIAAEHDRVLLAYAALALSGDLPDLFGIAPAVPVPSRR